MIECTQCDQPFNPKEEGARFAPLPVCSRCVDMNELAEQQRQDWQASIDIDESWIREHF